MNKYHAKRVEYDGIKFDSIFERNRWIYLKGLENIGIIKNLQRQVPYLIIPKQDGERAAYYKADFVYEDNGQLVVEDTKGFTTPDYILKRKLMLLNHGIRIQEVRMNGSSKKHPKKRCKKPV